MKVGSSRAPHLSEACGLYLWPPPQGLPLSKSWQPGNLASPALRLDRLSAHNEYMGMNPLNTLCDKLTTFTGVAAFTHKSIGSDGHDTTVSSDASVLWRSPLPTSRSLGQLN
jgi:hypothetical protein